VEDLSLTFTGCILADCGKATTLLHLVDISAYDLLIWLESSFLPADPADWIERYLSILSTVLGVRLPGLWVDRTFGRTI